MKLNVTWGAAKVHQTPRSRSNELFLLFQASKYASR